MNEREVVTKVFSTNGQYFILFASGTSMRVTRSTYIKVKRKLEKGHILYLNINKNSPYVFRQKKSTDINEV
ncbi:hypothetical protein ACFFIF_01850 [Vagococcus entomophilus]|uniref:Uncharacterized protein n=1 Tax=Vagococcus entomophilus TaxID=1160095 RepID=A0A430AK40_9ENTE|nr:hypothetical protein [Vagococcus entomophilus]RSU08455.1 hypothetical protein CBF30_04235 [Vagococcus entomophilus]